MGKQSDKKSKKWKIAAGIILVIQALISIVSVGIVVWFNLLPLKYLVLIGLILIWLLTLVYYFFYSGVRKKKGKKLTAQKKKENYISSEVLVELFLRLRWLYVLWHLLWYGRLVTLWQT